MKTHIEYDDFGEFVETLDDICDDRMYPAVRYTETEDAVRKTVRAFVLFVLILTAMLPTTSFAAAEGAGQEYRAD